MVFRNHSTKVAIYDVNKNEWSEESFEVTKNIAGFQSLKFPSLKFWFQKDSSYLNNLNKHFFLNLSFKSDYLLLKNCLKI